MQFSTIFTRAWQQKYLTPAERAIYKFAITVMIFIPNGAILAGAAFVLHQLHTSLPDWLWVICAAIIQVILTALSKYVTAQGDTKIGDVIQQVQASTASTMVEPRPLVLPPEPPVPPKG